MRCLVELSQYPRIPKQEKKNLFEIIRLFKAMIASELNYGESGKTPKIADGLNLTFPKLI